MGFLEIQLKKGKTSRHSVIRRCSFFLAGLDWKGIGAVLFAFIVTRAMIIIILYFSMAIIPIEKSGEAWRYNPRNLIADGLIRQDSRFYISIADHGYDLTPDKIILWDSKFYIPIDDHGYNVFSVAFFPLYPLFIRIASLINGNLVTSGLWVSNISFLIALFYLYAVTKQEFNDHVATRTVFYLCMNRLRLICSGIIELKP